MRNTLYKIDINVFSYINSEACQTFDDLINFLKKNNLPVLERWAFYLMGKLRSFDEKAVAHRSNNEIDSYRGSVNSNIYYWKYYLKHLSLEAFLAPFLYELKEEIIIEILYRKYFEMGWEYVLFMIKRDVEQQHEKERRCVERDNFLPSV